MRNATKSLKGLVAAVALSILLAGARVAAQEDVQEVLFWACSTSNHVITLQMGLKAREGDPIFQRIADAFTATVHEVRESQVPTDVGAQVFWEKVGEADARLVDHVDAGPIVTAEGCGQKGEIQANN